MHSADYVKARREVWVFRGGNGTLVCITYIVLCTMS